MPNWCSNKVTVKHKEAERINFAIDNFNEGKFCEAFVPLPNGEWNYDFCVTNWGTKWDVGNDGDVVVEDPNTVVFYFDSAWAPPAAVYEAMVAQGYEIEALYNEPGMAYCGKIVGNETGFDDDYIEYAGADSDTVRDIIGEELDDHFGISEMMSEWEEDQENLDIDLDGGLSAVNEQYSEDELIDELERIRKLGPHTD